jgi:hypothetical protein
MLGEEARDFRAFAFLKLPGISRAVAVCCDKRHVARSGALATRCLIAQQKQQGFRAARLS